MCDFSETELVQILSVLLFKCFPRQLHLGAKAELVGVESYKNQGLGSSVSVNLIKLKPSPLPFEAGGIDKTKNAGGIAVVTWQHIDKHICPSWDPLACEPK